MAYEIVVTGLPEAIASLDPHRFVPGVREGFDEVGRTVAREAAGVTLSHTFTGRSSAAIVAGVKTTGESISNLHTRVHSGRKAVGQMERGRSGHKQPPVRRNLANWMASKGIDPAAGFAIARAIGRNGYRYGALHEYEKAWAAVGGEAASIIGAQVERRVGP